MMAKLNKASFFSLFFINCFFYVLCRFNVYVEVDLKYLKENKSMTPLKVKCLLSCKKQISLNFYTVDLFFRHFFVTLLM